MAFAIGIPIAECQTAAKVLVTKLIFNEFVAYLHLADVVKLKNDPNAFCNATIGHKTEALLSYALCSSANFGSIGILISSLAALSQQSKTKAAKAGLQAMLTGYFVTLYNASIAGLLMDSSEYAGDNFEKCK